MSKALPVPSVITPIHAARIVHCERWNGTCELSDDSNHVPNFAMKGMTNNFGAEVGASNTLQNLCIQINNLLEANSEKLLQKIENILAIDRVRAESACTSVVEEQCVNVNFVSKSKSIYTSRSKESSQHHVQQQGECASATPTPTPLLERHPWDECAERFRPARSPDKKPGVKGKVTVAGNHVVNAILHVDKVRDEKRRKAASAFERSQTAGICQLQEEKPISRYRQFAMRHVGSFCFEGTFAVAIMTNAFFIGLQLELTINDATTEASPTWFVLNVVYFMVFTVELAMRMLAHGPNFFCSSVSWFWNWFDSAVFLLCAFEIAVSIFELAAGSDSEQPEIAHVRIIRIARVTRLVRVFRIIRIVRFIEALRNLIYSIACTLKSLLSALILLMMVIYVFGLLFAQATYANVVDNPDTANPLLRQYWGSLPRAMFTLFKSITGGVDWEDVVQPLSDLHWTWVGLFTIFLSFVSFAMLNVMTGVFCQSAIEAKAKDQDAMVPEQVSNRKEYIKSVTKLFHDIDSDENGYITVGELEACFADEFMQARFATLGVESEDHWSLFKLLDNNGDNMIRPDEFINGILEIRGHAKASDLAKMMYETRSLMGIFSSHMEQMRMQIENLCMTATGSSDNINAKAMKSGVEEAHLVEASGERTRSSRASASASSAASDPLQYNPELWEQAPRTSRDKILLDDVKVIVLEEESASGTTQPVEIHRPSKESSERQASDAQDQPMLDCGWNFRSVVARCK